MSWKTEVPNAEQQCETRRPALLNAQLEDSNRIQIPNAHVNAGLIVSTSRNLKSILKSTCGRVLVGLPDNSRSSPITLVAAS